MLFKRAARDDAGDLWGHRLLPEGLSKKKRKRTANAHACWLEGGAEKHLQGVNFFLSAACSLAQTYANIEQVLGRVDLGLFPEAEPCCAAPAVLCL